MKDNSGLFRGQIDVNKPVFTTCIKAFIGIASGSRPRKDRVFLYNLKLPEISYGGHAGAVVEVYGILGTACPADATAIAPPYVNKGSFIASAVADSPKLANTHTSPAAVA
jgi:hypothetical protein